MFLGHSSQNSFSGGRCKPDWEGYKYGYKRLAPAHAHAVKHQRAYRSPQYATAVSHPLCCTACSGTCTSTILRLQQMAVPLITVIGSLNADLITRTSRIPSAGETLTSTSFDTGFGGKGANQATACARLSRRYDSVGRGHVKVKMVGMIGDDTFGRDIRWPMVSNGIDISDVWIKEGYKTGVAVIVVEEDTGENRILLSPNANHALRPERFTTIPGPIPDLIVLQLEIPLDTVLKILEVAYENMVPVIFNPAPAQALPKEAYKAIRHLIVNESEAAILSETVTLSERTRSDSASISDPPPLPDTLSETSTSSDTSRSSTASRQSDSSRRGRLSDASKILETIRSSASSMLSGTMVGSSADSQLSTNIARSNASQTSNSSVLPGTPPMMSDTSADSAPNLSNLVNTAKIFHRFGVHIVIITLGARGVLISVKTGGYYHFSAEKVDVVDTTAAGDTFVGAYAVAIAKYRTTEHSTNQILSAVKWANKCAAKTVEKEGAQSAIPWLNEVRPLELENIVSGENSVNHQGTRATPSISATPSLTSASTRSNTPTLSDPSCTMSR